MSKTTIIYHSGDFDGIFCREIARKFLGEKDVEFIGWNFGNSKIPMPEGEVYIMDLSPDCIAGEPLDIDFERIWWIDHHKTSIDNWSCNDIPGYRIDGVAACRLAWQWFSWGANLTGAIPVICEDGAKGAGIELMACEVVLPPKDIFVRRVVQEPLAVRLVGEYDIWDKRDPNVDIFQYGLRTDDLTGVTWHHLLEGQNPSLAHEMVGIILRQGKTAQKYARYLDSEAMREAGFVLDWEGLKFLCLNSVARGSLRFESRDIPETGHDALLSFGFNGRAWTVSLYHAKHRTDLDLSVIAKKYGGGGHKGACGFVCEKLRFRKVI